MLESIVLGIVQGTTEWLPVSSEGTITAVGAVFFDMSFTKALMFGLWLHLGTAVAALVTFRRDLVDIVRDALREPMHPSPLLRFLALGTIVSAIIGFPMLFALKDLSNAIGGVAMLFVGAMMLITALVLRTQSERNTRNRSELTNLDAFVFGIAQGLSIVPGLSRSGLTVAALLGRGISKGEALTVSFVMSIPTSLGAALVAGLNDNDLSLDAGLVGAAVAAFVGIATIRGLFSVTRRISLPIFVAGLGILVVGGGLLQALG